MKHLFLVAALFAGSSSAFAQERGSYHAIGTEPFWSVRIGGGRMTYEDPEPRRFSVRTPRAQRTRLSHRYVTRRLTVTIIRGQECSDGMSDRRYADTVRVVADGRRLEGCGGAILPPETLADTSWEIVSIGGRRVPGGENYQIEFEANRMSGRAGCNRFSGSYRVGRDGFQAGPLAMTRMACPGPAMQHEEAASRILAGRVRLYYPDGRTLIMRGESGEIRLRRVI